METLAQRMARIKAEAEAQKAQQQPIQQPIQPPRQPPRQPRPQPRPQPMSSEAMGTSSSMGGPELPPTVAPLRVPTNEPTFNPYYGLDPDVKAKRASADMRKAMGEARKELYRSSIPGRIQETISDMGGFSPKMMQYGLDVFDEGDRPALRTAALVGSVPMAFFDAMGPGIILNKSPGMKQAVSNIPASIGGLGKVGEKAINAKVIPAPQQFVPPKFEAKSLNELMRQQPMVPKKDASPGVKKAYELLVRERERIANEASPYFQRAKDLKANPALKESFDENKVLAGANQYINELNNAQKAIKDLVKTNKHEFKGNDEFSDLGNLIVGGIVGATRVGVQNIPGAISEIVSEEIENTHLPRPHVPVQDATRVIQQFKEGYRTPTAPLQVPR